MLEGLMESQPILRIAVRSATVLSRIAQKVRVLTLRSVTGLYP
jgi:hypothetical protein